MNLSGARWSLDGAEAVYVYALFVPAAISRTISPFITAKSANATML
jgi:hypothetical protein